MICSWTFFWLVGGEVSGSQHHQPSGSNQSGVYMLVGSIQLTSPTWWGFQYLQNSPKILLCVSLDGERGPCPKAALLFVFFDCFYLVSSSPTFPDYQLFEPARWRSRRLKWSLIPVIKKWGTQKGFCVQEPQRVLLGINYKDIKYISNKRNGRGNTFKTPLGK